LVWGSHLKISLSGGKVSDALQLFTAKELRSIFRRTWSHGGVKDMTFKE